MRTKINKCDWVRKNHFDFFNQFEEPYHGVTVNIDCTLAYRSAKSNNISFFLLYLYQSLSAGQMVEPFRLRIDDEEVYLYDQVNAGSTVLRKNGTFGFANFNYYPDLGDFLNHATGILFEAVQSDILPLSSALDVIHYSPLPYINFTSHYRACRHSIRDSRHHIYFGQMTKRGKKRTMPVSIHVHHALVDGVPLCKYIDCFQDLMNQKSKLF